MGEDLEKNKVSIIFFGSPDFAIPSLISLFESERVTIKAVISQPEKERGRGKKITPTPVSDFAKKHGLNLFEPKSLKNVNWENLTPQDKADAETLKFVEFLNSTERPDFAVVVAYGKIIPEDLIKIAKHDFLNVHPSSLPRWRGSAPLQRTLISGDSVSSVCIMRLTKGLDEGPIYAEEQFKISNEDSLKELHDKTSSLGANLLLQTIFQIKEDKISAKEQNKEGLIYAEKILTADTLINWENSSQNIHNLVRGLSPHPGAQTKLGDKIVKIIKSKNLDLKLNLKPGSIQIEKKERRLLVACGNETSLEILQLKPEGKGVINASDFINGIKETLNLQFS